MRANRRERLLENLNDAVTEVVEEREGNGYAEYVREINRKIVDDIDNISAERVRKIVRETPINLERANTLYAIVAAIMLHVNVSDRLNRRTARTQQVMAAGLSSFFGIHRAISKSGAKTVVRNIHSSIRNPKSNFHKKGSSIIKDFKNKNKRMMHNINQKTLADIRKAQELATVPRSKEILEKYKEMAKDGMERGKIKYNLKRDYNAKHKTQRAIRTETHNQFESTKMVQARELGYTQKTWKTQSDDRVRNTAFHRNVHNKTVSLDDDFRGGGQRAQHPSDMSLKPKDRINCRCYMIMS